MEIRDDDLIFSTGKRVYANNGIIGISPDGEITEGYDGSLDVTLTLEEKYELADYAISAWNTFRQRAFLSHNHQRAYNGNEDFVYIPCSLEGLKRWRDYKPLDVREMIVNKENLNLKWFLCFVLRRHKWVTNRKGGRVCLRCGLEVRDE